MAGKGQWSLEDPSDGWRHQLSTRVNRQATGAGYGLTHVPSMPWFESHKSDPGQLDELVASHWITQYDVVEKGTHRTCGAPAASQSAVVLQTLVQAYPVWPAAGNVNL